MLDNIETASRLLAQISPYLLEAHSQAFAPSPRLQKISPSPHEALTYQVARAILSIGIRHSSLRGRVLDSTFRYLANVLNIANAVSLEQAKTTKSSDLDARRTLEVAVVATSLLGFLDAASNYTGFYEPNESLDLLRQLRQVFDENFMVSVEGVFSSIRTSYAA